MSIFLWITGVLAIVLVAAGLVVFGTLPSHPSDGDYGHAMLGVVLVASGMITVVVHGISWLVKQMYLA